MKNKVLVKLIVPEIDSNFDLFIPVNELIWKIKKLMIKSVSDLTGGAIDSAKDYVLINKTSSTIYQNNQIVINTDIRNATELILISVADT